MANNPKNNQEKMMKMLNAWRNLAPKKSFGGMTLDQFELLVSTSLEVRQNLAAIEDSRMQAIAMRDNNDYETMQKALLVIAGVVADPSEGDDSALYEAMGYVRKSNRKSGLTRKKVEPVK